MYLVRLIYCSRAGRSLVQEDVQQILTAAKANNERRHISGLLCFNRKFFLQALEGKREEVNTTYRKILSDNRHKGITIISYQEISSRSFDQWTMGYVPEAGLNSDLCLRYSGSRDFNPYEMSTDSCLEMMLELRKSGPVL